MLEKRNKEISAKIKMFFRLMGTLLVFSVDPHPMDGD